MIFFNWPKLTNGGVMCFLCKFYWPPQKYSRENLRSECITLSHMKFKGEGYCKGR